MYGHEDIHGRDGHYFDGHTVVCIKDAKIIFGLADPFDEFLGEAGEANDEIRITVVASGMQPQKAEVEQEKKILKEFKVEEVELPAILRKGPPRGF